MKATELQCYDLIYVDGKPTMVYGVMARMNRVYDTMTNDISMRRCEPMSLTADLLEKNGIKFQFGNPWYQYHNLRLQIVYDDVRICVDYVHELQHLLRICGLNELADNFKIK